MSSETLYEAATTLIDLWATTIKLKWAREIEEGVQIQLNLEGSSVPAGELLPVDVVQSKMILADRRRTRLEIELTHHDVAAAYNDYFSGKPDLKDVVNHFRTIEGRLIGAMPKEESYKEMPFTLETHRHYEKHHTYLGLRQETINRRKLATLIFQARLDLRRQGKEQLINVLEADMERIDRGLRLMDVLAEMADNVLRFLHHSELLDEATIKRIFRKIDETG